MPHIYRVPYRLQADGENTVVPTWALRKSSKTLERAQAEAMQSVKDVVEAMKAEREGRNSGN